MKKIIFVLFLVLLSCSKDDPETVSDATYSVSIQKVCPDGTKTTYSISKSTYDRINGEIIAGEVCQFISFKDLSLKSYSGYFRSIATVN
jgi:hypothetical protein